MHIAVVFICVLPHVLGPPPARRFKKQIFLSLDIPPAFVSMGLASRIALEAERRIVETLKEYEIEVGSSSN